MSKFFNFKNIKLSVFLANKYIRSEKNPKLPSFGVVFSCASIAIAVATLITVNSVMKGFEVEFIKKILGSSAHISVFNDMSKNEIDEVSKIKEIKGVQKSLTGQGLLGSLNNSVGVVVKGVEPDKYFNLSEIKCKNCDLEGFKKDKFGLVIGKEMSNILGVYKGDNVTVMIPSFRSTIFGNWPVQKTLKIYGVTSFGLSNLESSVVLLNIEGSKILYPKNDFIYEFILESPTNLKPTLQELSFVIPKISYSTWSDENKDLISAIEIERVVMFVLFSFFVCISMFCMFAVLTICIYNHKKNIAILSAMGLSRLDIGRIFFMFGMIVVSVGVFTGIFLGCLISFNIDSIKRFVEFLTGADVFNPAVYFLSTLPSYISFFDILIISCVAFTFGMLISVFAGLKAAKVDLSSSLRYF